MGVEEVRGHGLLHPCIGLVLRGIRLLYKVPGTQQLLHHPMFSVSSFTECLIIPQT